MKSKFCDFPHGLAGPHDHMRIRSSTKAGAGGVFSPFFVLLLFINSEATNGSYDIGDASRELFCRQVPIVPDRPPRAERQVNPRWMRENALELAANNRRWNEFRISASSNRPALWR